MSEKTTIVGPAEDGYDVVVARAGAAAAFALDHDLAAEDIERAVAEYRASTAVVPA